MFPNGEGAGNEVIRWEFLGEDEESFLGIEQWSESELGAATGSFVEDYEFTSILQARVRTDFLPGKVEALRYTERKGTMEKETSRGSRGPVSL